MDPGELSLSHVYNFRLGALQNIYNPPTNYIFFESSFVGESSGTTFVYFVATLELSSPSNIAYQLTRVVELFESDIVESLACKTP